MKSAKVLVTGANGFLGNNIVRVLLERHYRVVAMLRPTSDAKILESLDCNVIRVNFNDLQEVQAAVNTCDYVIHSAALTAQNITDFDVYRRSNVIPTEILVNACRRTGVKRFIFVSSASCFTGGSKEEPGDETSGFNEEFKYSGYAHSKFTAQSFVLHQARNYNFPAVVVAPAFMLGPYDPKPSSGVLILYILKNRVIFYPKGGKSFVDVRAVATATVNALTGGKIGESYLSSGVNISFKDFFRKVAALDSQKKIIIAVPAFSLKILEKLYYLFPSEKMRLLIINVKNLFSDNYFNNAKARNDLKLPATNPEQLILESIKWFRENGHLRKKN